MNYPIDFYKNKNKIKLLRFLYYKNNIIKNKYNVKYIFENDLDEIKNEWWWKEEICQFIVKELKININNNKNINMFSFLLNPWCIFNKSVMIYFCGSCNFGKRSRICCKNYNLYPKIKDIIKNNKLSNKEKNKLLSCL